MKLASLRQRVANVNSQLAATQVTFFFVFESKAFLASVLAFAERLLSYFPHRSVIIGFKVSGLTGPPTMRRSV
jgi:hypothetical protein